METGETLCCGSLSQNGDFTIASAYGLIIAEAEGNSGVFKGTWVWKLDVWPKIISFLCLCHHDNVPVRQVIANRGISCELLCPICKRHNEAINHMFRECPFAITFWNKLRTPPTLSYSNNLDLLEWLKVNCLCDPHIKINGAPWSTLFPFAIWEIWKHGNRVVFKICPLNLHLHSICTRLATEYFYCVGKNKKIKDFTTTLVRWRKPSVCWFKLNLDGASLGNPGKAGGGGLIRDSQGN